MTAHRRKVRSHAGSRGWMSVAALASLVACAGGDGARVDLETVSQPSICGAVPTWVEVSELAADASVRELVERRAPLVAALAWRGPEAFAEHPDVEDVGAVAGKRFCTVTVVDAYHALTAGHCFMGTRRWPERDGGRLTPEEAVEFMELQFDDDGMGGAQAVRGAVALDRLVEHSILGLDFALLRLKVAFPLAARAWPDLALDVPDEALPLTIIQHPFGGSKKVASGKALEATSGLLRHDVDTEQGSSGAAILDQEGRIYAIHRLGRCETTGNEGQALLALATSSPSIACLEARSWVARHSDDPSAWFAHQAKLNWAPRFDDPHERQRGVRSWQPCSAVADELMQAASDTYAPAPDAPDEPPPDVTPEQAARCAEIRAWVREHRAELPPHSTVTDEELARYEARNWAPAFRNREQWSEGFWAWVDCSEALRLLDE